MKNTAWYKCHFTENREFFNKMTYFLLNISAFQRKILIFTETNWGFQCDLLLFQWKQWKCFSGENTSILSNSTAKVYESHWKHQFSHWKQQFLSLECEFYLWKSEKKCTFLIKNPEFQWIHNTIINFSSLKNIVFFGEITGFFTEKNCNCNQIQWKCK